MFTLLPSFLLLLFFFFLGEGRGGGRVDIHTCCKNGVADDGKVVMNEDIIYKSGTR